MIDRRGRIAGLVNAVDAAVAAAVCVLVALAALTYRSLTLPAPRVDRIEPATITDATTPITIRGAHLRPFVRVFLNEAGQPPVVSSLDPAMRAPAPHEAKLTFVGPEAITLALPPLTPGRYDIYLFDDDHQIAALPAALTLARVTYPQATLDVTARFFAYEDRTIKAGAVDEPAATGPPAAVGQAARVRDARQGGEVDEMQMRLAKYAGQEPFFFFGRRHTRRVVDVRLEVPALMTAPGRWEYRGHRLRAGEPMALNVPSHFEGEILWVGEPR
jgi:hypothetical protein